MKKAILLAVMTAFLMTAFAQSPKVYDPAKDAMAQLDSAVAVAAADGRYVLCQVGGNWCPWCLRFAQFAETDTAVHQVIEDHFVYIHLNYSKENKNPEAMRRLRNPGRFGFPVFVILDEKGEPIHIQNSEYLEEGRGYSEKKVVEFLLNWTPEAVRTLK